MILDKYQHDVTVVKCLEAFEVVQKQTYGIVLMDVLMPMMIGSLSYFLFYVMAYR